MTAVDRDPLLTADEKAALAAADLGDRAGGAQDRVRPYELDSQENAVVSVLPVLRLVQERFCERLQAGLGGMLRCDLELAVDGLEFGSCGDFMDRLSAPCGLSVFAAPPLTGPGVLAFERDLVFAVVGIFFGGAGRGSGVRTGEFTHTEARFVDKLRGMAARALEYAWQPCFEPEVQLLSGEHNPQFVTAVRGGEAVVLMSQRLTAGEEVGRCHLMLPCAMFDQVRGQLLASLQREYPDPDEKYAALLREGIKDSRVSVRGLLTETELTLQELLALRVGDFIPLEVPKLALLEVEGVAIYAGQFGVAQGQTAVKLDRDLRPDLARESEQDHD